MEDEEQLKPTESDEVQSEEKRASSFVHISMLCAMIVALLCEVINLVEVIVNRRVSFPMFALSFFVIGVFATVLYLIKASKSRKLLICGIICLVATLAFMICWVLVLCNVIK